MISAKFSDFSIPSSLVRIRNWFSLQNARNLPYCICYLHDPLPSYVDIIYGCPLRTVGASVFENLIIQTAVCIKQLKCRHLLIFLALWLKRWIKMFPAATSNPLSLYLYPTLSLLLLPWRVIALMWRDNDRKRRPHPNFPAPSTSSGLITVSPLSRSYIPGAVRFTDLAWQ